MDYILHYTDMIDKDIERYISLCMHIHMCLCICIYMYLYFSLCIYMYI